jgi:hypothetical protein
MVSHHKDGGQDAEQESHQPEEHPPEQQAHHNIHDQPETCTRSG